MGVCFGAVGFPKSIAKDMVLQAFKEKQKLLDQRFGGLSLYNGNLSSLRDIMYTKHIFRSIEEFESFCSHMNEGEGVWARIKVIDVRDSEEHRVSCARVRDLENIMFSTRLTDDEREDMQIKINDTRVLIRAIENHLADLTQEFTWVIGGMCSE